MASTVPTDASGVIVRKPKFHNGWTSEQEELMSKWADMGTCYRWLHDRCEKLFSKNNMSITIPVIILSTLTGTASVGLNTFVGNDPEAQKFGQITIGIVSLIAGILSTLGNFLRYAQLTESHRVAGISWGKFQRQIAVELSLHPNDRLDSMDFIKICRAELDRLIEQSPAIPDKIIELFTKEFKNLPQLKRPDIAHGIEHTEAFKATNERMKVLAGEASLFLLHKKKLLKEEIIPDIDNRLTKIIDSKILLLKDELNTGHTIQTAIRSNSIAIPIPSIGLPRTGSAFDPDWRKLITSSVNKDGPPGGLEIRIPQQAPTKQKSKSPKEDGEVSMRENPMYKKSGKKDTVNDSSETIVEVTEK